MLDPKKKMIKKRSSTKALSLPLLSFLFLFLFLLSQLSNDTKFQTKLKCVARMSSFLYPSTGSGSSAQEKKEARREKLVLTENVQLVAGKAEKWRPEIGGENGVSVACGGENASSFTSTCGSPATLSGAQRDWSFILMKLFLLFFFLLRLVEKIFLALRKCLIITIDLYAMVLFFRRISEWKKAASCVFGLVVSDHRCRPTLKR